MGVEPRSSEAFIGRWLCRSVVLIGFKLSCSGILDLLVLQLMWGEGLICTAINCKVKDGVSSSLRDVTHTNDEMLKCPGSHEALLNGS